MVDLLVQACGALAEDLNLGDVIAAIGSATDSNMNRVRFDGLIESIGGTPIVEIARLSPSPDVRLFAKPKTLKNRRMGVALARGSDVDEAIARAKAAAAKVRIVYRD